MSLLCVLLFCLRAHEHIYFMECALSQNVLLPLLMVHLLLECITITITISAVNTLLNCRVLKLFQMINLSTSCIKTLTAGNCCGFRNLVRDDTC